MNFDRLAQTVARGAGKPFTFIIATPLVISWGVSGPIFGFSDTWQLVLNLEEIGAEDLARIKSGFVELGRKHKAGVDLPEN